MTNEKSKSQSGNSSTNYFGYQLASRWERFIASLIQGLILVIPIFILTNGEILNSDSYISAYDIIINIILALVIGGLLYPIWSGNIGHKIFGIKVISSENGEDLKNPVNGITREFLKNFLSYLILPVLWLLWDKDRQNWYDKISKTIVVRKK